MANCRGCNKDGGYKHQYHAWQREDAYGIPTGWWCDNCYSGDAYPYRKDDYFVPAYAGERLEED